MEKIKDILHDFNDIFIALIIGVLMFGVVAWNLGDWFNQDNIASAIDTMPIMEEPPVTEELAETIEEATEESNETEKPDEKTEETPPVEPVQVVVVDHKQVTIPSGTPGSGIARILMENDLIESTQEFIQIVESLNLASRLKSGTFQIPAGATLEDIAKIIAGQN